MGEEAVMEEKLITRLTQGVHQWERREDLRTIPELWVNFFQILSANNQSQLADVPLTANEKETIRTKLIQPNFYRAAELMVGANRQVRIHLKRDDSTLPDADLLILDDSNIAGGTSVYQVVHQVQVPKTMTLDQDRRFDVTLLINGLPFIHIELKSPNKAYSKAFNQIQKYIDEGKFSDIYCFVQMFVVTNGTSTRYIAAGQQLNPKFLTSWVDSHNQAVDHYLDFARDVLSIPAAHHMIADYTVLDSESKKLILLRPYQIHAIEAIFKASREGRSGYVWHTTGSGKTLTSYKVARNLLQIPSLQKTVFLIDRKDLDMQTTSAFQTYANNDTINVTETNNSYELADQLISSERTVIVTTRQKLQTIFKRLEEDPKAARRYAKLKDMRLAFIVDECHRTVTPSQKRELDKFFHRQPLWYGFTGTPIFDENARDEKGQEARTTEQLYGPCLHKYTIEDAIRDKTVLGFKVENLGDSGVQSEIDEGDYKKVNRRYLSEPHMRQVVKNILTLSYRTQGLARGHRYSAILTTSSIQQAQRYYELFKSMIAEGAVPKRIKEVAPDFPRIAITYSVSQNEDGSYDDQKAMKQAMADYDAMFKMQFSMTEFDAYSRNVNDRLARKKKQYQLPGQQLDLVIVVDRLLTGFDSPQLSTLYIDRPPMNSQNLIQAFSRTNRICDDGKGWGQIITFQYPDGFDEAIDRALKLYSNGGTNEILAPDWKTTRQRYLSARRAVTKYLQNDGQSILTAPEEEQRAFVDAFRQFDKETAAIQTYDQLDRQDELKEDQRVDLSVITDDQMQSLRGTYENVVAQLQKNHDDDDNDELDLDDDYELEAFQTKKIDYRYITSLIQACVPDEETILPQSDDKRDDQAIETYIDHLAKDNPPLAEIIRSLWHDVQNNPQKYTGKQIDQVLEDLIDQENEKLLQEFATRYQLNYDDLRYVMANYDPDAGNQQKGMNDLMKKTVFDQFIAAHSETEIKNFLEWKRQIRQEIAKYYTTQIEPLMKRD